MVRLQALEACAQRLALAKPARRRLPSSRDQFGGMTEVNGRVRDRTQPWHDLDPGILCTTLQALDELLVQDEAERRNRHPKRAGWRLPQAAGIPGGEHVDEVGAQIDGL